MTTPQSYVDMLLGRTRRMPSTVDDLYDVDTNPWFTTLDRWGDLRVPHADQQRRRFAD